MCDFSLVKLAYISLTLFCLGKDKRHNTTLFSLRPNKFWKYETDNYLKNTCFTRWVFWLSRNFVNGLNSIIRSKKFKIKSSCKPGVVSYCHRPIFFPKPPPSQTRFIFFPSQWTLNRHRGHSSFANTLQDNPARLAKYSGAEKKIWQLWK
jgi:hypothetical protein